MAKIKARREQHQTQSFNYSTADSKALAGLQSHAVNAPDRLPHHDAALFRKLTIEK
jgi:hypothetical protein